MGNVKNNWITRFRIPIIVTGILLMIGVVAVLVYSLVIPKKGQQTPAGQTNPTFIDSPPDTMETETTSDPGESPLFVKLSAGQAEPQMATPISPVTGEPLSEAEIDQILSRLPGLVLESEDQVVFARPEDSLPPPRTGKTITDPFPPPVAAGQATQVEAGSLEVLRFAPEGEIPIAPFVNVTFNQPMVPIATLSDLTAEEVPVVLEPPLPGDWRWVGTKTLTFQYESTEIDRLPKATAYQVTIPAGTTSAMGGVLGQPVRWSFSTPPPKVTAHYPSHEPQPLDPLFFYAFDQRINPAAVLDTIEVTANNQQVKLKLASTQEIKKNKRVNSLVENTPDGRWLVFKSIDPLPADAAIAIAIGPGTPSAEGPLVTQEVQRFDFRTYAPLRIDRHGCSWSSDRCRPLTPFFINFNNPIDVNAYDDSMLTIKPELPGAAVDIFGNTINIRGVTQGRTTYQVIVDGNIRDIFGQPLGKDTQLTFRVGSADPFLVGPDEILVTLDPAARKPIFSVYAINYNKLHVQAYAVDPSHWQAYKNYLRIFHQQTTPPKPPGRQVMDKVIPLEAQADVLTELGIDLSEALDGKFGHLIVIVEPERGLINLESDRYRYIVQAWVQVTHIGLDAFSDHSEMLVWASALQDGAPLAGLRIESEPEGVTATTNEVGLAKFALPSNGPIYLTARQGNDIAILPRSTAYWRDASWNRRAVNDEIHWYVVDDRQMYRPGEDVHVKGWLRRVGGRQDGDVGLLGDQVNGVQYTIIGPQGNELGNGFSEVNVFGGFDFTFILPENANLGYAQISLSAQGNLEGLSSIQHYHNFQIQEFRRPEFEVKARNETTGPYFVGDHAVVAVEATYFAGGPLPNAEVSWQVISSPSDYDPPNWPDFTFGVWKPWWSIYELAYEAESYPPYGYQEGEVEFFTGTTDASGEHYLRLDFDDTDKLRPFSVLAEATVFDVNRQAWVGTTSLLVHPANLYVGMRSERTFVERGEPIEVDLIVTDLDGIPVSDRPVEVKAARLEWKYRKGNWREEEVDIQKCTIGSAQEPVTCTFKTELGGRYQITAVVSDALGRFNQSQITRWVSGGQQPPARQVEQEAVTLIPDREFYQPGDMAQILVQSPFTPAEGLLTVSRSGMLFTEHFRLEEDTITLQVAIAEQHIPNLHVQVDLVGSAPRLDDQGKAIDNVPPRPAYASGQLNLNIPPLQRTLSLEVKPREAELEPGGETILDLELVDANQKPVADAELAVIVVDEAVLALSNYQLADPVAVFYRQRGADFSSHYGRASIVLADPQVLADDSAAAQKLASLPQATQVVEEAMMLEAEGEAMARAPASAGAGAETQPIRVRMDFNPLATFAPQVHTDVNGTAQVKIKLPDNLTRYRVMVVAVDDGNWFGSGEANLTARLPLMVRPSAPRFLNFGDSFELPIVLQNQTDELLTVDVVAQASNIEFTRIPGLRVDVPARDRLEVRFPATTVMAGTARFQIAAVSGNFADAATVDLPVYTPATTEAFATYGVVDEGAVSQPVVPPSDVFAEFGGLEISTSSTALQALTDAVLYLVSYPFECTEQLASRILAVSALRDVLTAFSAEGLPSPTEMENAVLRDIERLAGLQNSDGGFPYWRRGKDSIPYHTVHVAHALQRAKLMGFEVPDLMHQQTLEYLRQIENYYPSWYSKRTRHTISSYAIYVRTLVGDRDAEKARKLLNEAELDDLSLEAIAWLWVALIDTPGSEDDLERVRRHITNRAVETPSAANFTTFYGDDTYLLLHSNRRTDAIILDALIAGDTESDLIPKVVNGLLAHRTQGRWHNTQENVFVLLALDRYFKTYEAQTPDFVARIWLGDTYAGDHQYTGRTTERHETIIPMNYLVAEVGDAADLLLSKEGPGRLYYRLGLRYAPTDLTLDPLDMGFVVQRRYEAVDDPEDVVQDQAGRWLIKAGARVRVRLTMVADNRRYHVALVDPLPAGLEIINPALAVSGSIPQDPESSEYRRGWWWWTWYEHQNMRDERAEAFATLLWEGVHEYSYIARATTPGTFVVPPTKAEEMYSPEVFGRGGSDWVVVE